jgi:hypothetical protein
MVAVEDSQTKKQESFCTEDRAATKSLLNPRKEAARQPQLNLQIAKAYLAGTESGVATRTWQQALDTIVESKSVRRSAAKRTPRRQSVSSIRFGTVVNCCHRLFNGRKPRAVPTGIAFILGDTFGTPAAATMPITLSRAKTTGVHTFVHGDQDGRSPFGVADLAVNVREWVSEGKRYGYRGLKGGSWGEQCVLEALVSYQIDAEVGFSDEATGLRLCS